MAPPTPQRSERPGEPVALLGHRTRRIDHMGGPEMAPRFAERRGYAPSDSPANARSAPGNPWRSSVTVRGGSLMLVAVGQHAEVNQGSGDERDGFEADKESNGLSHRKDPPVEDADHAAAM